MPVSSLGVSWSYLIWRISAPINLLGSPQRRFLLVSVPQGLSVLCLRVYLASVKAFENQGRGEEESCKKFSLVISECFAK